ncbi:hypothetical protein CU019_1941 [Enterococcus faecium]|nr:hypothetical protein [Enterococcus faecium]MBK4799140.1 hypothetical protein [Enterococcus faecium]MBK4820538.1 hypothetical protein [Enterococcus faecium]
MSFPLNFFRTAEYESINGLNTHITSLLFLLCTDLQAN